MSTYTDVSSYALAVKLRKRRTLLVEGSSDRQCMLALIAEFGPLDRESWSIDTASIIRSGPSRSPGNRDKVLSVADIVRQDLTRHCGLADKVRFLVDREWEGAGSNARVASRSIGYLTSRFSPMVRLTQGHSIENYFYCLSVCSSYLRGIDPESFTVQIIDAWNTHFEEICRFAFAYSWVAAEMRLITKLRDLLRHSHISLNGSALELNSSFAESLSSRGIADGARLCHDVNNRVSVPPAITTDSLKWFSHGPLGLEAFFCSCATLALSHGANRGVVDRLGNVDVERVAGVIGARERHRHEFMPLAELAEWLVGQPLVWS